MTSPQKEDGTPFHVRAPSHGTCSTAAFPCYQFACANQRVREQTLVVIPGSMIQIFVELLIARSAGKSLTDILALNKTILDCASKTLTSLLLVTVVESGVEETVALLDGVVDGLRETLSVCGVVPRLFRLPTCAQVSLVT